MPLTESLHKRIISIIFVLCLFLCLAFGGVFGVLYLYKTVKIEISQIYINQLKTSQYLLSSVNYNAERQKLILFSRDQIIKRNKNIKYDQAFYIASINVKYSEIYPSVDPLMLLALQDVESAFNVKAVSPMGAIGLNQIMPFTARQLCKGSGIAYADSMLYDADFNTRMGAMVLDDAIFVYKKNDVAMACYNGGPYSAYYYSTNNGCIPLETKNYVSDILKKWKEYREMYKSFVLKPEDLVKTDANLISENLLKK